MLVSIQGMIMWLTIYKDTTLCGAVYASGSVAMSLSSRKACKKSKQLKSKS